MGIFDGVFTPPATKTLPQVQPQNIVDDPKLALPFGNNFFTTTPTPKPPAVIPPKLPTQLFSNIFSPTTAPVSGAPLISTAPKPVIPPKIGPAQPTISQGPAKTFEFNAETPQGTVPWKLDLSKYDTGKQASQIPGVTQPYNADWWHRALEKVVNTPAEALGFLHKSLSDLVDTMGQNEPPKNIDEVGHTAPITPAQRLAAGGQAVLATANLIPEWQVFNTALKTAQEIPTLSTAAKAIQAGFDYIGKGGSAGAGEILNLMPMSDQTRNDLRPIIENVGGFVSQFLILHGLTKGAVKLGEVKLPGKNVDLTWGDVPDITIGKEVSPEKRAIFDKLAQTKNLGAMLKQGTISEHLPGQSVGDWVMNQLKNIKAGLSIEDVSKPGEVGPTAPEQKSGFDGVFTPSITPQEAAPAIPETKPVQVSSDAVLNGIQAAKDDYESWLEETMKKDVVTPEEQTKLSKIEQYQAEELKALDKEMKAAGTLDFHGQTETNYQEFVNLVKNPKLLNPAAKEKIQSGDVQGFKNLLKQHGLTDELNKDIFNVKEFYSDDDAFLAFRERLMIENPKLLAPDYAGRPSAPARIKIALGRQRRIKDMKAFAEKMVRQATIKEVPIKELIKPEPAKKITRKETTLLKNRLEAQSFGARKGAAAGEKVGAAQQKNIFRNIGQASERSAEMRLLKEGMKIRAGKDKIITQLQDSASNAAEIKAAIVNEVTAALPVSERGKFINMVKNAETRKDLVKAYLRINDAEQNSKLKAGISDLKKVVDKLSDGPAISADYRNKIKELVGQYELSGHTDATLDRLKATQKYIDTSKAAGVETEIPQRILEKLKILTRVPKDELTLNQVEGLKSEIELLGKLGETKWSSKEALYDAEKEARKNVLLEQATPINASTLPRGPIGSKPKFWIEKFVKLRNGLQKTRVGLTPMDGLAEITGVEPMKAALDLNFANYLTFNDDVIPQWHDITKDFDDSNFKRIGTHAIAQQEGGAERLANSGITSEELDNLKLTPQEEKAYQFVLKTFDANFPAVKKYALDNYNADVGQQKNYVSFMSDYSAMSDLEVYDRFGQRAEDMVGKRTKTVEQGFTKERAKTSPMQLETNIDKIFRRHMDDVAYMLTMGRDIKQYFEIINSPEMRAKLGDVGTMAWLQWLDLMARKGGVEGGQRIAVLDTLRQNISMGVLAFRASSALVQFTTLADTAGTIGPEYTMKGATSIATSKEWRNFIMDNFPEIKKSVGDDIAFREFSDDWRAKVAGVGLKPLQFLDGMMRSTAAAGSYMKFADEAGIEVDLEHPDKKLIQEATLSMRQSQGSSFFKDQPLALSAGYGLTGNRSLNKTLLTFQSFMLSHWDNIERQVWRTGIKEGNYKKAGLSFFWLVIVAAGMEEGIRRGVKKLFDLITGDTSSQDPIIKSVVLNMVQSIPIVGSLVSALIYSSNPVPTVNTFEELLGGVGSAYTGVQPKTKAKGLLRAIGAAGTLAGVPGSSQAAQTANQALFPTPKKTDEEKQVASVAAATKKETDNFRPTYNKIQSLIKTDPEEAKKMLDGLSDADYENYKKIKSSDKAAATKQAEIKMYPTVKRVHDLIDAGKKDEAAKIIDGMSDEDYRIYGLAKKAMGYGK